MGRTFLQLNTFDIEGGAARATFRMHEALVKIGANSRMLVSVKRTGKASVVGSESTGTVLGARVRHSLDRLPLAFIPQRASLGFSTAWLPERVLSRVNSLSPSLIHIHWINAGWIQIETLGKLGRPLLWTLQDMWPFTGGCHYDEECGRYSDSCGICPLLKSTKANDLSRWIWQRKNRAWVDLDLTIIAVSKWVAECAQKSSLFRDRRIEIIPNGLNIIDFSPLDKKSSRQQLKLPEHIKLILFGGLELKESKRKGFHLLRTAIQNLAQTDWGSRIELVLFGQAAAGTLPDLGVKVRSLGMVHDDLTLSRIYSSADVVVVPSLQEAFGQIASEAMACGTPVVAFNNSGLKDIVDHKRNGYLAKPFEAKDLAEGIMWVLSDQDRWEYLSREARSKVEREFDVAKNARRLLSLYEEILAKHATKSVAP